MLGISQNAANDAATADQGRTDARLLPLAAWTGITAVLYLGLAFAATWLSRQPGSLATVWYANAVAVSLLLARPTRQWPVLLIAIAIANATVYLSGGESSGLTLSFVVANVAEILLSSFLVRRFCEPDESCCQRAEIMERALIYGSKMTVAESMPPSGTRTDWPSITSGRPSAASLAAVG